MSKELVTEERIQDILDNAFDGAISHWAFLQYSGKKLKELNLENLSELPLNGGEITVIDVETDEILGKLDEQGIKKALELMSNGKDEKGREIPSRHIDNIINENDDFETADVLVQLAVMGEIVFG